MIKLEFIYIDYLEQYEVALGNSVVGYTKDPQEVIQLYRDEGYEIVSVTMN